MAAPDALRYREFPPPPALRPWARCVWTVAGTAPAGSRQRVLPDGCADLLIEPVGGRLRAHWVGTQRQALVFDLQGPVRAMGLRLRPGAAGALLHLPAHAIADGTLPFDEHAPGPWRELRACLTDCADLNQALRALEQLAAPIRGAADARQLGLVNWLEALRRQPLHRVRDLSEHTGLTARTLERRLRDALGLSPREYLRFMRFEQMLRAMRRSPTQALAVLALEAGYADQAHASREFRRHAGMTPRQWRARGDNDIAFEQGD